MKTLITIIASLLMAFQLHAQVSAVYVGGPFVRQTNEEIDELRASGFNTVILWTIHVDANGKLSDGGVDFTDSDGNYIGDPEWGAKVARLKQFPSSIDRVELCISAYNRDDFKNINTIIDREGTGPESILYKAFTTVKNELGVDAINYDDEDHYDAASMTALSIMLADIGFKVTLVPYTVQDVWGQVYTDTEAARPGAIDRVYLQGYAGGSNNQPSTWNPSFGDLKMIHGLWSKNGAGCGSGDSPAQMKQKFTNFKSDISGGFVWVDVDVRNCESAGTLKDYATAINEVFDILPPAIEKASNPLPADGATEVSVDADLTWTGGTYDAVHSVYFGTTPTLSSGDLKGESIASTYDPGTLVNNTTYYWRVDEKNSTGEVTGDTWSYTTEVTTPLPGAVANPFPADMATEDVRTDATLTWDAGAGAISYDVYFGKENPPPFMANQTGLSYTPEDIEPLTTYYWQINSVNSTGTTTGAIWSYTTQDPNIAPAATVTVSTEFNSDFSGTKLTDGIIGRSGIGEWASNGESTPWAKLTWDNEVTIKKVVLYDRASNEDILSGVLEFGEGTTMNIESIPGDGSGLELDFSDIKTNSVEFRVLTSVGPNIGMTEFEVFGIDEIGGLPSKPRLTRPQNESVDVATDVTLDWGFTKNATSFNVYLSESDAIEEGDLLNTVTATQLETMELKGSTTYYWRVDAVNFLGTTQSDVFSFTTAGVVTSIDSEDLQDRIKIYPNPTEGRLQIQFRNNNTPVSLALYSPLGNKVYEQTRVITGDKITLDLSKITSSGKDIYLLRFVQSDKQVNRTIVLE
ncbi:T9SS type A sorting domain-containing protein [Fulvivirga sp. M361]|uniref:DUF7402 domain-containing protein n=1 Tax=Fulvivirga sp. M361 TaxID=2594266 RepID=UPI001179BC43|nr:T9SS type A sorting domain-containing protein [Fulvivirga sp. M361]TRX60058.1 T9SS type A sorting domain-containing protein [Fulvivirga sp. M361]